MGASVQRRTTQSAGSADGQRGRARTIFPELGVRSYTLLDNQQLEYLIEHCTAPRESVLLRLVRQSTGFAKDFQCGGKDRIRIPVKNEPRKAVMAVVAVPKGSRGRQRAPISAENLEASGDYDLMPLTPSVCAQMCNMDRRNIWEHLEYWEKQAGVIWRDSRARGETPIWVYVKPPARLLFEVDNGGGRTSPKKPDLSVIRMDDRLKLVSLLSAYVERRSDIAGRIQKLRDELAEAEKPVADLCSVIHLDVQSVIRFSGSIIIDKKKVKEADPPPTSSITSVSGVREEEVQKTTPSTWEERVCQAFLAAGVERLPSEKILADTRVCLNGDHEGFPDWLLEHGVMAGVQHGGALTALRERYRRVMAARRQRASQRPGNRRGAPSHDVCPVCSGYGIIGHAWNDLTEALELIKQGGVTTCTCQMGQNLQKEALQ